MALIYSPNDAFVFAQAYIKYMPLDDLNVKITLLDLAAKRLWTAAPWRWTLGEFPLTALSVNDPVTPVSTLPSDFLFLESAYIFDGAKKVEPEIVSSLSTTTQGIAGIPSQIAITGTPGAAGSIICHPFPASGTTLKLVGIYKKQHPTITTVNVGFTGQGLPPDEWFWVYLEMVLLYAFKYADYDQRVGGAQTQGLNATFSGQMGVVEAAVNEMRFAEKLPIAAPWLKQGTQTRG